MNSVTGSCGVLDVHRLFVVLTSPSYHSDLPFAVSCARLFFCVPFLRGMAWTTIGPHVGVFLISSFLFSFSPVTVWSVARCTTTGLDWDYCQNGPAPVERVVYVYLGLGHAVWRTIHSQTCMNSHTQHSALPCTASHTIPVFLNSAPIVLFSNLT